MGREIRRVPKNWEHPKTKFDGYRPLYEPSWEDDYQKWQQSVSDFEKIGSPYYKNLREFIDDEKCPDPSDYVDYSSEEAIWYQVYETVSQGTPVTPPFSTPEQLAMYLHTSGDFWQQDNILDGEKERFMSYEVAFKFVNNDGWVPSCVIVDGVIKDGYQSLEDEHALGGVRMCDISDKQDA